MRTTTARLAMAATALFGFLAQAPAQGVELRHGAVVYFGSASNTTAPATIDEDKVRESTPEYKTIKSEGIRKGSARYKILLAEMDQRVRAAVRATVGDTANDLVVREGDIANSRGKTVADVTDDVIERLNEVSPRSD